MCKGSSKEKIVMFRKICAKIYKFQFINDDYTQANIKIKIKQITIH